MASFERTGYFWLPADPETKLPGKLTFAPKTGGSLELLGILGDEEFRRSSEWELEFIHGYTRDPSECVTLHCCRMVLMASDPKSFSESEFVIERIFSREKGWFTTADELSFRQVSLAYTHLDRWMSQITFEGTGKTIGVADIKPLIFRTDGAALTFWPTYSRSFSITEVSMKCNYGIAFQPNDSVPFETLMDIVNVALPSFFNVGTGHVNTPTELYGQTRDERVWTEIFYQIHGYADRANTVYRSDMFFTFEDVKERLQDYLCAWLGKFDRLRTAYSLYFNACHHGSLDRRARFLDLVRALEAYHRSLGSGEYVSESEYEPILRELYRAIPSCVQSDHRRALEGSLKYGFQYSLRTRLKKLCGEVLGRNRDEIDKLLWDRAGFIHRVVESRNFFTHLDGEPSNAVFSDRELYKINTRLRLLVEICLLNEIGIPPGQIARLLQRHQEYNYVSNLE